MALSRMNFLGECAKFLLTEELFFENLSPALKQLMFSPSFGDEMKALFGRTSVKNQGGFFHVVSDTKISHARQ